MEIQDRIKQKAEELFRKYGIRSVTMNEIAAQLGISKKTIYQYYADKDELVGSVVSEIITGSQCDCTNYSKNAHNAIHEVFLLMEMIKEMFENMNPSIIYDLERWHHAAFQHYKKHKNEFVFHMIKENILRGIKEGLYREEIDPDVISTLRLESMMMSFNQDIFPRNKVNVLLVEQQIIEHFLFGIANLKGHKLIIQYQKERIKNANKDEKKKVK